MLYFFIIFIALCLYKISFKNIRGYNENFLSRERTAMVNGIFVMIIVFSHFNGYVKYTSSLDLVYNKIILMIGQLMVTTFFFYSGYGIYESIKRNKEKYIDEFLKKRFFKVFLSFALAVIIYIALNIIVVKKSYSIPHILLAFTGWTSVGNSNWFIFATFYLYLATYLSFRVFKKNNKHSLMLLFLFTLVYIPVVRKLKAGYWVDTVICYNFGMLVSYYKERIVAFLSNNVNYGLCFAIAFLVFAICFLSRDNYIVFQVMSLAFIALILLFTFKVSIGNKVLYWLGKNTFNIYILQRISYTILGKSSFITGSIYLYFISSLAFTLILVLIFDKILKYSYKIMNI